MASVFGIKDIVGELSERGWKTRGITDITYSSIPFVQEALDVGEDVRHADGYRGMNYAVFAAGTVSARLILTSSM